MAANIYRPSKPAYFTSLRNALVLSWLCVTFFRQAYSPCVTQPFQLPIPALVASVAWRMRTSGWKQGHRELATTPSGSRQSLSSLQADTNTNHHHHHGYQQQQQQQQARAGNEYGAVTPSHNGRYMHCRVMFL